MSEKALCFTGHRYIRQEQKAWAINALVAAIERAAEGGYNWFWSGGASGADWWFTQAVSELVACSGYSRFPDGIANGLALPFKGFLNYYAKKKDDDKIYIKNHLLPGVDIITTVSEGDYSPGKLFARNDWLVAESDAMVSVYDGRKKGGTHYTLGKARKRGIPILWLNPVTKEEIWINT